MKHIGTNKVKSKEASYKAVITGSKESTVDNLHNVRREVGRHFGKKRRNI
jgi:hypothetical protein